MSEHRITSHPILDVDRPTHEIPFTWGGQSFHARAGETIASALFANGVRIFGHHRKDGAPQGIFCANGQCAQCMVIADGVPVKACMTFVREAMVVEPLDGLPTLPPADRVPPMRRIQTHHVPVLILGGGPAGMSAALELARQGIESLLVDDKAHLGGKLVLQTHRFFGSRDAVYAGTRGIDIAAHLEAEVREQAAITIWTGSTAVAVFSDKKVGILREGSRYELVEPRILLVATGARERSLVFLGDTLPGVYGAGAFQTLVNRDLVRPAKRLFIVGGGNVGLIAGYHALQAGIEVVGLVEALPECGGYKVHRDKLARLGVPISTSHTILSANGTTCVESVTVAEIDERFRPVPGTERSYACDTVLVAVGLDPVDEFYGKAQAFGLEVFAAGDAEEIAEASAAIFSGRIKGREIARRLGAEAKVPAEWSRIAALLKSKPGTVVKESLPEAGSGVFPVLHCLQEIPCNPCSAVCPSELIRVDSADIRHRPRFLGTARGKACVGCASCVAVCPGLAITLVDYRKDPRRPTVTLPYELSRDRIAVGDRVAVLDTVGEPLGTAEVSGIRTLPRYDHTLLVDVLAAPGVAERIAGIEMQGAWAAKPLPEALERLTDDAIVCRCERVTAGEIRALIRDGHRDMNAIKAVSRAGMGACGGKTCTALIRRLFREEGVPSEEIEENVVRPLFVEVDLGTLAGCEEAGDA
jgi:sarcosine oxidase, subunit alpha